ncbi:MAG: sulfurtransferase TusA family protein [Candidatus Omnitrophica bacterium]|nr:sulfurtransferase TusA family protein [Candidatus Omnitrophota bacterium]
MPARTEITPDSTLDCWGLLCPMPVRKTAQALEGLAPGQVLLVIATDDWFGPDLEAWLRLHPHELLGIESEKGEIRAYLRKTDLPRAVSGSR